MNLKYKNITIPQFSFFYRKSGEILDGYVYLTSKTIDNEEYHLFLLILFNDIYGNEPFNIRTNLQISAYKWDALKTIVSQQYPYADFNNDAYRTVPLFDNGSFVKYNNKERMYFNVYKEILTKNLYRPLLIDYKQITSELESTTFEKMRDFNDYKLDPRYTKILYSSPESSNIQLVKDYIPIQRKPSITIADVSTETGVLDYIDFTKNFAIVKDDSGIPPKVGNLIMDLINKTYQLGREELIIEYDEEIEKVDDFDTTDYKAKYIESRLNTFYPIIGQYSDGAIDLAFTDSDGKIYDKRYVFLGIEKRNVQDYQDYFDYKPTYGKKPKRKRKITAPEPIAEPPKKRGISKISTGNITFLGDINTWNYQDYPPIEIEGVKYMPCIGINNKGQLEFSFVDKSAGIIYSATNIYNTMPNVQNVNQYTKIDLTSTFDDLSKFRYPLFINSHVVNPINVYNYKHYYAILTFPKYNEIKIDEFPFWAHFCKNLENNRYEVMWMLWHFPLFSMKDIEMFCTKTEKNAYSDILDLDLYNIETVRRVADENFNEDTKNCFQIPNLKPEFEAIEYSSTVWFVCFDVVQEKIKLYNLNHLKHIITIDKFKKLNTWEELDEVTKSKINLLGNIDSKNLDSIQSDTSTTPYKINKYIVDLRSTASSLPDKNNVDYMPVFIENNNTGYIELGFIPSKEVSLDSAIIPANDFIDTIPDNLELTNSILAKPYFTELNNLISSNKDYDTVLPKMRYNQTSTIPYRYAFINSNLEFIKKLEDVYNLKSDFKIVFCDGLYWFYPVIAREKGTNNFEIAYIKKANSKNIVFTREMVTNFMSPDDEEKYQALIHANLYDYETMIKISNDITSVNVIDEPYVFDEPTGTPFIPIYINTDELTIVDIISHTDYSVDVLINNKALAPETIEILKQWKEKYEIQQPTPSKPVKPVASKPLVAPKPKSLSFLVNDLLPEFQFIPMNIDPDGNISNDTVYYTPCIAPDNSGEEKLAFIKSFSRSPKDLISNELFMSFLDFNAPTYKKLNDFDDSDINKLLESLKPLRHEKLQKYPALNKNIHSKEVRTLASLFNLNSKFSEIDTPRRSYIPVIAKDYWGDYPYFLMFRSVDPDDEIVLYKPSDVRQELDTATNKKLVDLFELNVYDFKSLNRLLPTAIQPIYEPIKDAQKIFDVENGRYYSPVIKKSTGEIVLFNIDDNDAYTKEEILASDELLSVKNLLINNIENLEKQMPTKKKSVPLQKPTSSTSAVEPKDIEDELDDLLDNLLDDF